MEMQVVGLLPLICANACMSGLSDHMQLKFAIRTPQAAIPTPVASSFQLKSGSQSWAESGCRLKRGPSMWLEHLILVHSCGLLLFSQEFLLFSATDLKLRTTKISSGCGENV